MGRKTIGGYAILEVMNGCIPCAASAASPITFGQVEAKSKLSNIAILAVICLLIAWATR